MPVEDLPKRSKKKSSSRKLLAGITVAFGLITLACFLATLASHCGYTLRLAHDAVIGNKEALSQLHRRDGNASESEIPIGVSVPVSTQTALSTIYTIRSTAAVDTTLTKTTTRTTTVTPAASSHDACTEAENSTVTVTVTVQPPPAYTEQGSSVTTPQVSPLTTIIISDLWPTSDQVTVTSTHTVQRTVTPSVVTVTVTYEASIPSSSPGITSSVLGDVNTLGSTTVTDVDTETNGAASTTTTTTTTVYPSSSLVSYYPPPANTAGNVTVPPVVSGANAGVHYSAVSGGLALVLATLYILMI